MDARNFIIYGIDDSLCEDKIKEIVGNFASDTEILNRSIKDDGISQILGELNTPNFLSSNKAIIITDGENIFKLADDYYKHFLNYLANPASFSVLIILFKDIKMANFNDLKSLAVYYDLTNIKISNDVYLKEFFNKNNYKISDVALSLILDYGDDLTKLKNIALELMCYKIDTLEIVESDIRDLLVSPLENNVYELCNAVIKRDGLKAYLIYNDLTKSNMSITYLLGLIINKMQEIYNNAVLVNAGYSQNDLAELYSVKLGRAYYMLQDAKNNSIRSLKRTLNKLYSLEYGIKKGTLKDKVAFSSYLLSL